MIDPVTNGVYRLLIEAAKGFEVPIISAVKASTAKRSHKPRFVKDVSEGACSITYQHRGKDIIVMSYLIGFEYIVFTKHWHQFVDTVGLTNRFERSNITLADPNFVTAVRVAIRDHISFYRTSDKVERSKYGTWHMEEQKKYAEYMQKLKPVIVVTHGKK